MSITKTLSTLSLAFAMVGGTLVFAPSKAEAGNNGHISYDALRKNQGGKKDTRPGQPANKYNRGCSAIQKCRG
jgi:hypothetical protein